MTTIEAQKAVLLQQMATAEQEGRWYWLEELTQEGLELDPDWFVALCYLQAATSEIAYQKHSTDPYVLAFVQANRRVRRLADAQQQ